MNRATTHSVEEPRVVFAHDWLNGMRGGERVLEQLCHAWPEATIYTLLYKPEAVSPTLRAHRVKVSPLNALPGVMRYYRNLLPLFPPAIRAFAPPQADLIVSCSHCVAKGLRKRPGTRHLCYCFTPMRYAWFFHEEYFSGRPFRRTIAAPILSALRRWDRAVSRDVDRFVAISACVRERIRRCYDRDAEVVFPPVNTDFFTPGAGHPGSYDLLVSALVPYKRVDLAVKAYTRSGAPLVIIGTGTEAAALRASAGKNIRFLGWRSDAEIREYYRGCRCLVFPGREDFGIVPLEAQACGRPVVAFGRDGVLETVHDGSTGLFFDQQTPEALWEAVERCAARAWDQAAIRRHAETFSTDVFQRAMRAAIQRCLQGGRL